LDSSRLDTGDVRFSFMGDASGPHARIVNYRVGKSITVELPSGETITHNTDSFSFLESTLSDTNVRIHTEFPFDFTGGYVGYLGYEIEGAPRRIYLGAIGYLSLNATVDLNIVIRTIVITPIMAEIGVGGAITYHSDAEQEYDEMILKALAPFSAMRRLIERPTRLQRVARSIESENRKPTNQDSALLNYPSSNAPFAWNLHP
jgi:anthranilate/para-aminobenzoate synthase component I